MIYDSCIIGGGPAGITAAMYLARSGCTVCMFEEMALGGQVLQTAELENYPGFPHGIKGYELADAFAEHIANTNVERVHASIISISGEVGQFTLATSEGRKITARTVIVCSGAKHRKLGLPNEDNLLGHGVSYCALCDGNFYRGQDVAVVGGGNAALEESLYLSNIVNKVHLIHRRDTFRGRQIFQERINIKSEKIILHTSKIVTKLLTTGGNLSGICLQDVAGGEEEILNVQGLFVYVGFMPITEYLPDALQKDTAGFIITDTEMNTSISGIFAAGDIRSKNCRQAITAAGDGATAAQSVFLLLEQLHG